MTWNDDEIRPSSDEDGEEREETFAIPGAFSGGPDDDLEDAWGGPDPQRWPLDWHELFPRERWLWFERLWADVCHLGERYRLSVRSRWWEDAIQVETLAALSAWTARYDSGEWDDPPGKLALLLELQQIESLLRGGNEPFQPCRDRLAFERHLATIGAEPPPSGTEAG